LHRTFLTDTSFADLEKNAKNFRAQPLGQLHNKNTCISNVVASYEKDHAVTFGVPVINKTVTISDLRLD